MAITDYKIGNWKEWTNEDDFPTYQSDEGTVRADLQYHPDYIKNTFNNMLDNLNAGQVPFSSTIEIPENNIQAAIANVQSQVAGILDDPQSVVLPNNSIVTVKLQDKSVTLSKLDMYDETNNPNGTISPTTLKAADREHYHDTRYYTQTQIDNYLAAKQERTDLLQDLDAVADADILPLYDDSETAHRKITWAAIKAAIKAYIDGGFAENTSTYHAGRHRPGGADMIHIATENIDDEAVTNPKLSTITVTTKYSQTVEVEGLEAEANTRFSSESDISALSFNVEDGKLTAIADEQKESSISVTIYVDDVMLSAVVFQGGIGDDSPWKEFVASVDEETAAVQFDNIKTGAVSTIYTATIPAFIDLGLAWEPVEEGGEIVSYTQTVDVEGLVHGTTFTVSPEKEGVAYAIHEDGDKLIATWTVTEDGEEEIIEPDEDLVITVTQSDEGYDVTIPARKKKSAWEAGGTPFTQELDIEGFREGDEATSFAVPLPTPHEEDDCEYEKWALIFNRSGISVSSIGANKIEFTAAKRTLRDGDVDETIWVRVELTHTYDVASVSKNGWSNSAPYTQKIDVPGIPPDASTPESHEINRGVMEMTRSTTSTGNAKTSGFDKVTDMEIDTGGGKVTLTAGPTAPTYDFQITFTAKEFFDIKLEPDWTAHAAPWVIEIPVEGLLESDNPIVDLQPSLGETDDDMDLAQSQLDAWAGVFKLVTSDGELKIYSQIQPQTDMPIRLLCIRK